MRARAASKAAKPSVNPRPMQVLQRRAQQEQQRATRKTVVQLTNGEVCAKLKQLLTERARLEARETDIWNQIKAAKAEANKLDKQFSATAVAMALREAKLRKAAALREATTELL